MRIFYTQSRKTWILSKRSRWWENMDILLQKLDLAIHLRIMDDAHEQKLKCGQWAVVDFA